MVSVYIIVFLSCTYQWHVLYYYYFVVWVMAGIEFISFYSALVADITLVY